MRVVLPTVLGMPLNHSYPLHIPFASLSRITLSVAENKSGIEERTGNQVNASLLFHNAGEYDRAGVLKALL